MAQVLGVYATVYETKQYLHGVKKANFDPADDALIARFCIAGAREFDAYCKRWFFPRYQTRYYDHPGGGGILYPGYSSPTPYPNPQTSKYNPRILCLDADLLAVKTLTTDNGNTTISASDYFLKTGFGHNLAVKDRIELKIDGTQTVFDYDGTPQQANAVTGIWGYHETYEVAWQQVDTVQDDPLAANVTTVTVGDVDGDDVLEIDPRFQRLQLIRFGNAVDSEMAFITKTKPDTNEIEVKRGVNGTTAAQQAQGTAIYVYEPMPEIKKAMQTLAAYSYRRRESLGTETDRPIASSTGMVILPAKLPQDVLDMLDAFKKRTR